MSARNIVITFILFLSANSQIKSQALRDFNPNASVSNKLNDRIWIGGNVGLQFGSQTLVQIAPLVGYRLTDKLMVGVTGNYIYYKVTNPDYSSSIYGGGLFGRYFVIENLYLHSEYEVLNMEVPNIYGSGYRRTNVTSVLVGGGYRQWMSDRAGVDLMLLWNINQSIYSPYSNPIIRMGFIFAL